MFTETQPHDDLADLVTARMTDGQLAEHYGVTTRTIQRWRKAAGIPTAWVQPSIQEHGKARYDRGCRCTVCTAANTDRARRQRADRLARTIANGWIAPIDKHGYTTAENWYCRCDVCRAGIAERNRAYRARKAAQ